jgi:hypothetical protein
MSDSLTGFFRAEVYVIHELHSTDDFFIRQPAWPKKSRLLCNLYTIFYPLSVTINRLSFYRNRPCGAVSPTLNEPSTSRPKPASSPDFFGDYQPFTTRSISHRTLIKMIHGGIFPQN